MYLQLFSFYCIAKTPYWIMHLYTHVVPFKINILYYSLIYSLLNKPFKNEWRISDIIIQHHFHFSVKIIYNFETWYFFKYLLVGAVDVLKLTSFNQFDKIKCKTLNFHFQINLFIYFTIHTFHLERCMCFWILQFIKFNLIKDKDLIWNYSCNNCWNK